MDDNNGNKANEKEAKKQFFEELKSKNKEENKKLEELKKQKEDQDRKLEELNQSENQDSKEDKEIINNEPQKDDFSKEEEHKDTVKIFNGKLKASIIDTITTSVVSVIGLYLFDLILRLLFGYRVVDMKGMFIIIFIIVLVLYPFVMSKTKYKVTLGQKFGE